MNNLAISPNFSAMKYADELKDIETECPNSFASARNCTAYRFVSNPTTNNCFIPQAKKQPKRVQNESDAKKKCELWGLSMFDSLQNAEKRYNLLKKSFKNIKKTLGDHIAEGPITVSSGVCTKIAPSGHFDVYEYSSTNFRPLFRIVKVL